MRDIVCSAAAHRLASCVCVLAWASARCMRLQDVGVATVRGILSCVLGARRLWDVGIVGNRPSPRWELSSARPQHIILHLWCSYRHLWYVSIVRVKEAEREDYSPFGGRGASSCVLGARMGVCVLAWASARCLCLGCLHARLWGVGIVWESYSLFAAAVYRLCVLGACVCVCEMLAVAMMRELSSASRLWRIIFVCYVLHACRLRDVGIATMRVIVCFAVIAHCLVSCVLA